MIGKRILHYEVNEKLGQGGMGEVYLAEDTKLNRKVALKFLPLQYVSDQDLKTRFKREAQAAAALNHPNIITIHEVSEYEGRPYMAMEYVEGGSLKDLVRVDGMSVAQVTDLALQISEGLAKAHQAEIVHRDIKPQNILIDADGRPRICDFGLAKLKREVVLTQTGTTLGTIAYMSPEQARGEEVDHRADIWSLGVVIYEMLTGQRPFRGDHDQAVIYAILNNQPGSISEIGPDTPDLLVHIVEKAMAKSPDDRYQDMAEVMSELRSLKAEFDSQLTRTVEAERRMSPSIAVLPFANLSADKEQEYFCDGMAEDILNALTKVEGLHVVGRTSAFAFKGKHQDIRKIGRELSVSSVLEGSVRKANNWVRITAQLINVADGYHIWSERFDRQLDDVFEVQADVAQKVACALEIKLTSRQIERIEKRPTRSIKAYDYYLRGREYYWRIGKEDLKHAIKMYEKALEIDSNYALAYAGLADVYVYQYEAYYDRSLRLLDAAEEAAKKALATDYDMPEAHRALGRVYKERGNSQEAISELKKAIDLRPDFLEAYRALGWICEETRDFDKAILYAKKALDIRSSDQESYLLLGLAHFDKKEYEQAIEMFQKAVQVSPDYGTAYCCMGNTHQRQGEFDQALKMYDKCIQVGGDLNVYLDTGMLHLLRGEAEQAAASFGECIGKGCFEFLATYYLGLSSQIRGRKEEAQGLFRRSIELCETMLRDDPGNPYVHSTIALALTQLGRHSEAVEHAERAASLDPKNGAVLYDLARVYAQQGKVDDAVQTLRKALDAWLSPSPAEARLDPHFEILRNLPEFCALVSE